jgi:hypothetical protein
VKRFVIALALLALPAQAQEVPFQAVSGQARLLLADSAEALLYGLDPASRAVMQEALAGPDGQPASSLWARIMAGALQVRREGKEGAETLWFNPLLDAGLLVRWARSGAGWQIVRAVPLTGETLRGGPKGDGLGWIRDDSRLASGLKRSGLGTFGTISSTDWTGFYTANERDAVLRRAARAEVSVEAMQQTPGYETALPLLAELMVAGNPKLPAAMIESLKEMGERARIQLGAASAFRLDDGWVLALQSASAPGVTWLVTFADGAPALPVAFTAVGMEGQ